MKPLSTPWSVGSPGEIPSFGISERATVSLPPWSRRLGEPGCRCLHGSLFVVGMVDVGAAAPDVQCLYAEAAASGTMESSSSMRRGSFSTWLVWQLCVAWAMGLSARSMRPGLTSRRGGGPG